jgi:saccharopine dehydrogenase-like NADP-dependent oxidoreductase
METRTIASFLAKKHVVHVFDQNVNEDTEIDYATTHVDLRSDDLAEKLNGAGKFDLVINACPHFLNVTIAKAAKQIGSSYIDLSEDVESGKEIEELAGGAKGWFVPRCGVAPGLVQILAGELAKKFDVLDEIKMRVGALPRNVNNALGYALTWSTDGLINEYANPCEAVVNEELVELPPLEGLERAFLDGTEYEAFNTSGGLGTLARSMKARNINYKTLRYPGHRDLMKFLMFDLRMSEGRDQLKMLLERYLPITEDDQVIVYVSVSGYKKHAWPVRLKEFSYLKTFTSAKSLGKTWSAIQRITGGSAACVAEMILDGDFDGEGGYIRQEDIDFAKFSSKSHWKMIQ